MSSKPNSKFISLKKDPEKTQQKLWEEACEAEGNFQIAVDMVSGFLPIKTEEDWKFVKKWIFFIILKKMNPERISISDCTLGDPIKRSSGKISFCLLPCLNDDQQLKVKLATKFKIFAHQEETFSMGITIPEENLSFFKDLEKRFNSLAVKKKSAVKELGPSFARFQEGDFTLIKIDKSEQEKIYAKIYPSKIPTTDFSCRFWELENGKKKPILRQKELINVPLRGQVVFSIKHLFCGNAKTITCIVDEVLVEEMVQATSAFDEFEDKNEEDL